MLPFLNKRRQDGGSAVSHITKDGQIKPGESDDMGLISAAEDLCRAIESKDHKAVAAALRSAFEILESMPHEESNEIE